MLCKNLWSGFSTISHIKFSRNKKLRRIDVRLVADSFLDWLAPLLGESDTLLIGGELDHLLWDRVTLLPGDLTTLLSGHLNRQGEKIN